MFAGKFSVFLLFRCCSITWKRNNSNNDSVPVLCFSTTKHSFVYFFFSISENSNIISKYDTQNCSMKIFLFWPLLCNKQMCSWNLWVCHLKFHRIWFQQVIHLYITLPGGLKTENLLVAAVTRHWDFGRCGKMDTDFLFSNENRKKLIIYILLNFD